MVSEIKRIPLMGMSGSASEIHVHLYIVVQCGLSSICEDGTAISVENCVTFSVLVNKCVRPSCSLGDSTYPKKRKKTTKTNKAKPETYHIMYHFCSMRLGFVVSSKAGDLPYNVSFLFYETWFCCLTIFIRYFRGLTLFSITNVVVLI